MSLRGCSSACGLSWCPDVGAAAPEGGFLLRAELGGGSAGGGTRPRRLVSFMASYRRARGVGDMCAGLMAVWSVLLGRLRGLRLIAGRKPCLGCQPGPTMATPLAPLPSLRRRRGDALASPPGFSGANPRSLAGSGEGGAHASLASWGLALDVSPSRGTSGVSWWLAAASSRLRLGGARPWGRRGCRSGGSGLSPPPRSTPGRTLFPYTTLFRSRPQEASDAGAPPSPDPSWDLGFPPENPGDRKSTRLNSSHSGESRMPSSA